MFLDLQITIGDGSLLEKDGRMVVQMEWINSHLLYNEQYNRLYGYLRLESLFTIAQTMSAVRSRNFKLTYALQITYNNCFAITCFLVSVCLDASYRYNLYNIGNRHYHRLNCL